MSTSFAERVQEGINQKKSLLPMVDLAARSWLDGFVGVTDEQLEQITEQGEELDNLLRDLSSAVIRQCRLEVVYRHRRRELDTLPTEQIRERYDEIKRARSRRMIEDTYDELDDSFFEAPAKHSDEHIAYEILVERNAIQPY